MTTKTNTAITQKYAQLMSMNNDMRNLIFSIANHEAFMNKFKKSVLSLIEKHNIDACSDDPTLDDAINTNAWAYVRYLFENFEVENFEGSGFCFDITDDNNTTNHCRCLQIVFNNEEVLGFEFEWDSNEYEEFAHSVYSLEINDSNDFDEEAFDSILSDLLSSPCIKELNGADFVSINSDYNIKLRRVIENMLPLVPF